MDGLKYIIPMSGTGKKEKVEEVPPMFAFFGADYKKTVKKAKEKAGKPVYIMDWEKGKPIKFESLLSSTGAK